MPVQGLRWKSNTFKCYCWNPLHYPEAWPCKGPSEQLGEVEGNQGVRCSVHSALFNGASLGESPCHRSPRTWALDYLAPEGLSAPVFRVSWLGFSLANHGRFKSTAPVPLPVAKNLQNQAKQAALSAPVNRSQEPGRQPNLMPKNRKNWTKCSAPKLHFKKLNLETKNQMCIFKNKTSQFWTS